MFPVPFQCKRQLALEEAGHNNGPHVLRQSADLSHVSQPAAAINEAWQKLAQE